MLEKTPDAILLLSCLSKMAMSFSAVELMLSTMLTAKVTMRALLLYLTSVTEMQAGFFARHPGSKRGPPG